MTVKDRSSLFTNIARAMSRNWQVNVVPSGYECCTDGETIKYPFNADHLKGAAQKVLHGLLDHEVAHVADERDHAEAGQTTPLQLCRKCESNREKMMLNVFEDVRIETKYSAVYPGVSENLNAANVHSVELYNKKSDHGKNFWHTLGCGIIFAARGLDTSWMPAEFAPYMAAVADEITAAPKSKWGADSLRLARSVIAKVADKADELDQPPPPPPPPQGDKGDGSDGADGGSDSDGSEGDDSSDGADSGKGSEGKDQDSKGDSEGKDGSEDSEDAADAQGDSESKGEDEGEGSSAENDSEGDEAARAEAAAAGKAAMHQDAESGDILDEAKAQIIFEAQRDAETNDRYVPHPKAVAADRWIIPETKPTALHQYDIDKQAVAAQIRGLKGKLLNVIRARAASKVIGDQRKGELDSSRLASVRTGNRAVFQVEQEGETLDTAITILIDLSGSMGDATPGEKAYYARLMAVALSETFAALNIPFEVLGFHTVTRESIGRSAYGVNDTGYSRTAPMEYHVFKSFKDSFRRVRARLTTIRGRQDNVDCEAVLAAAKRLAQRPEARKIMFVLSDGQPAGGGVRRKLNCRALVDAVKKVTAAGIEVIGIGAQTETVQDFYNADTGSSHVIVNDIETLAVSVYKLMRERLLGAKGRAA